MGIRIRTSRVRRLLLAADIASPRLLSRREHRPMGDDGFPLLTEAASSRHIAAAAVDESGQVTPDIDRAGVEKLLDGNHFFWLDIPGLGPEEVVWLRDVFHFHHLAIEDAVEFGQRPKAEEYEGYLALVLYGSASPLGESSHNGSRPGHPSTPHDLERLSEVHCFISARYIVTVHRAECPSLLELRRRIQAHPQALQGPAHIFYRLSDVLVDSFFPVLADLDDRIDTLQDEVMAGPRNRQLHELLDYKSALITMRRVITPQRDLFAALAARATEIPGFRDEHLHYLRDVYDHLIRLSDLVDSYRDLLSTTADAYLSVVSNQLNVVMKQLTIIATVFLPLSFLTGFFGQNFGWLVNRIGSLPAFLGIGIGTEVFAVAVLMSLFWWRGWIGQRQS